MSVAIRKKELQPLPIAVQNLDKLVKPRRKKKKIAHTKDPYKKRLAEMPLEKSIPEIILDGFLILKETKCEMPHEVIKLKVIGKLLFISHVADII